MIIMDEDRIDFLPICHFIYVEIYDIYLDSYISSEYYVIGRRWRLLSIFSGKIKEIHNPSNAS